MSHAKMDADLHDVYLKLVASPNRAEQMTALYEQLHAFNRGPKHYVLPNVYGWMKPVIEVYGYDPEGLLDFYRSIVEHFSKRTDERVALRKIRRKVESWADQIVRRRRVGLALEVYKKVHGEFSDKDVEKVYARRIFALWKLQRMNVLLKMTREHPDGRASAVERRDACEAHWQKIEKELEQGTVPTLDQVDKQIEQAAGLYELLTGKPPKQTW